MQLHGQTASLLKCKQNYNYCDEGMQIKKYSTISVKIDHNHESQLRKLLFNFDVV